MSVARSLHSHGRFVDIARPDGTVDHVAIPDPPEPRERFGQSALPRFNRYSIKTTPDPLAVDCPYCVKRPRDLRAHCRAVHPDKPEAR